METKKSYSEQLKDPRWQKKRLEIMSRDNFRCFLCEDSSSTLHVHHKKYIKGKQPWDYVDDNYITLCEKCHELGHIMDVAEFESKLEMEREIRYWDDYETNKQAIFDDLFENDTNVPVDPFVIKQLLIAQGNREESTGNFMLMCMLYDLCDVTSIENINTIVFKVYGDYKELLSSYKNVLLKYLRQNALNSDITIKAIYTDGTYRLYL